MTDFFTELKRRNVLRMAGLYLVGAWLLTQVASTILPMFGAPEWLPRTVVILLAIGFVPALIVSWAFELTPEGLKRDEEVPAGKSIAPQVGRRMDRMIIVVLVLALGYFAIDKFVLAPRQAASSRTGSTPNEPGIAIAAKSIAVLPFENFSRDPDNEFFTNGVQDEILTYLAKIADLKVISRTSVMQYKTGGQRNLRQIAKELGVAHVVEGSVQRAVNKIRVIAQLIDARNDTHLWAQTYDRDVADVFAIQSEIAKAIADGLQAKISPAEKSAIEQPPTTDVVAFDLYSRAKAVLAAAGANPSSTKINLPQAVDLATQAIARDPSFFPAHCLLALAHDRMYHFGIDHTPERVAQARAALDAAAGLRPDAGETHLARAQHLYMAHRDYAGALAELEVARQSLPNEAGIYELRGYIARRQGKLEECQSELERALQLDPRNFFMLIQKGVSDILLHRYPEAATTYDRALVIYPDNVDAQIGRANIDWIGKADTRPMHRLLDELRQKDPVAYRQRADELFELSMTERDVAAAQGAVKAWGEKPMGVNLLNYNAKASAARVARLAGDVEKARADFIAAREEQEKLVQAQPDSGPALALLALYDAALGRKEEALREGRRAMELLPREKDAINGTFLMTVFAKSAAWLGEKDVALEYVTRAAFLPGGPYYGQLKLDSDWDPLRGDPHFEALLADLAPKP
jgi:TolB-like protein/Tfp pilus assembly protein PilF